MKFERHLCLVFLGLLLLSGAGVVTGQSRHASRTGDLEGAVLNVTASRTDGSAAAISVDDLFLYEDGIEQRIRNFTLDPSPARIVLIVDNSQTLPVDLEKLKGAAMEFAYEIFDGDQLFVIAYDEKPEIVQEWTDNAERMLESFGTFRKKGNPHLFDAINSAMREVLLPLMPGTRKTAIVVIGDGLDRGSVTMFDSLVSDLQFHNITVYALQLPDRTGGAYRRNMPKPAAVISQLTELTGGKAFPLDEAQEAARMICDELRKNRYLLSYQPLNTSTYDRKRVFLFADEGIKIRTKAFQPPNIR